MITPFKRTSDDVADRMAAVLRFIADRGSVTVTAISVALCLAGGLIRYALRVLISRGQVYVVSFEKGHCDGGGLRYVARYSAGDQQSVESPFRRDDKQLEWGLGKQLQKLIVKWSKERARRIELIEDEV